MNFAKSDFVKFCEHVHPRTSPGLAPTADTMLLVRLSDHVGNVILPPCVEIASVCDMGLRQETFADQLFE